MRRPRHGERFASTGLSVRQDGRVIPFEGGPHQWLDRGIVQLLCGGFGTVYLVERVLVRPSGYHVGVWTLGNRVIGTQLPCIALSG